MCRTRPTSRFDSLTRPFANAVRALDGAQLAGLMAACRPTELETALTFGALLDDRCISAVDLAIEMRRMDLLVQMLDAEPAVGESMMNAARVSGWAECVQQLAARGVDAFDSDSE